MKLYKNSTAQGISDLRDKLEEFADEVNNAADARCALIEVADILRTENAILRKENKQLRAKLLAAPGVK